MLTLSKAFDLTNDYLFIQENIEEIEADLKGSKFLPATTLATGKRHIQVARTTRRWPETLKFCQNEALETSDEMRLEGHILYNF